MAYSNFFLTTEDTEVTEKTFFFVSVHSVLSVV